MKFEGEIDRLDWHGEAMMKRKTDGEEEQAQTTN